MGSGNEVPGARTAGPGARAAGRKGCPGGRTPYRGAVTSAFDRLHEETFGVPPSAVAPLAGDGSRRRMERLTADSGATCIGVHGPDALENRAFVGFARALREAGLPVPQVLATDDAAGLYLVEDLGDVTLYDALQSARDATDGAFPPSMHETYLEVVRRLARLQVEGGRAIDYALAYPRRRYDAQAMQWDCNYFKYDFLKLAGVSFHEGRLEEDFGRLIAWLTEADAAHFMHRDMQSRNVMLRDGEPWFIDFQGGLQGAPQYDVAKLLHEGKTHLPAETRDALLDAYLEALGALVPVDRAAFLRHLRGFVVLRILQGLGAYGLLGLYQRKPQFLARIPHALRDVETLLADGFLPLELPELRGVFERMVARRDLRREAAAPGAGLTVRVASFSYKRGLPEDEGGHGGGFVFDCRALPNPGRLSAYRGLTGLDAEVVAWLESQAEVEPYVAQALALVAAQVDTYRTRGFDSLQVLFGCTGGQHRSVYCAERLAAALRARFPDVTVPVRHAETQHWPPKEQAWTR